MAASRQAGFSLVELMIALVIGLIIVLGAGQLFLMGFQNFRQVELLGNKQAALTFAADTLIRDIRRGNNGQIGWDNTNAVLSVEFDDLSSMDGCSPGDTVNREYFVSDNPVSNAEGWSLKMRQNCGSGWLQTEPLVTGLASPEANGLYVDDTDASDGIYIIKLCLIRQPGDNDCDGETIDFHAVNRTAAMD